MVEWFLNLSISLFALSNGGRRVWATVLFLRAIMYRKVVFFCHICQTTVCWDADTMATGRNDFSFLDKIASFPGLSLKGGRERSLGTSMFTELIRRFETLTHPLLQDSAKEKGETIKYLSTRIFSFRQLPKLCLGSVDKPKISDLGKMATVLRLLSIFAPVRRDGDLGKDPMLPAIYNNHSRDIRLSLGNT